MHRVAAIGADGEYHPPPACMTNAAVGRVDEVRRWAYPLEAPASAISTSVAWVTPVAPRAAYGYALRK